MFKDRTVSDPVMACNVRMKFSVANWHAVAKSVELVELEAYYGRWGHCNAGMNTPTGRWVRVQRRLNREGKLPEAQVAKLEALDFDFADYVVSEDPEEFDTMFGLLLAYGNTHPNLQVDTGRTRYSPTGNRYVHLDLSTGLDLCASMVGRHCEGGKLPPSSTWRTSGVMNGFLGEVL
eukprot:gene3686-4624_t